jgi:predicted ATPase
VDNLLQGQGKLVSLTGEPGLGKSRLLEEIRPLAENKNILWLKGECRKGKPGYHLWAELLRSAVEISADDEVITQRQRLIRKIEDLFGAEEVDERGPFLASVLGLPQPANWKERIKVWGTDLTDRLAEETAAFFDKLSQSRPLVLVCEDLHWLDEESAGVFSKVMELITRRSIILIYTHRPGEHRVVFRRLQDPHVHNADSQRLRCGHLSSIFQAPRTIKIGHETGIRQVNQIQPGCRHAGFHNHSHTFGGIGRTLWRGF